MLLRCVPREELATDHGYLNIFGGGLSTNEGTNPRRERRYERGPGEVLGFFHPVRLLRFGNIHDPRGFHRHPHHRDREMNAHSYHASEITPGREQFCPLRILHGRLSQSSPFSISRCIPNSWNKLRFMADQIKHRPSLRSGLWYGMR